MADSLTDDSLTFSIEVYDGVRDGEQKKIIGTFSQTPTQFFKEYRSS